MALKGLNIRVRAQTPMAPSGTIIQPISLSHRRQRGVQGPEDALEISRIGARVVDAVPPKEIIVSKCSRINHAARRIGSETLQSRLKKTWVERQFSFCVSPQAEDKCWFLCRL